MTMRVFTLLLFVAAFCNAERNFDASLVDKALKDSVGPKGVPGLVAVVATPDAILYRAAYGEAKPGTPMAIDSVFRIFSMTKAVTSVAAMQLVEQGKIDLHAPVDKYLPELAGLQVLTGFDASKKPLLVPAKTQPTIRQLLSHSAGFGYSIWDENLNKYPNQGGFMKAPLVFHPGERWQYGTNTDVIGKVVEKVSGKSLDLYFKDHIIDPLGMKETAYLPDPSLHARIVSRYERLADRSYKENPQAVPAKVTPQGGGGLFSTAEDYVRFMQMILNGGGKILKSRSIKEMRKNQIGSATVRQMKTTNAVFSRDFEFHPGAGDKFGLGFQLNPTAYKGGRGQYSMAWAGAANTFFWIDPKNKLCAVIFMQTLPFFDEESIKALQMFEKAVYSALKD